MSMLKKQITNRITTAYGLKTISADQMGKRLPFYFIKEFVGKDGLVRHTKYEVSTDGKFIYLVKDEYQALTIEYLSEYLEIAKLNATMTKRTAKKIIRAIEVLNLGNIETFVGKHVKNPVTTGVPHNRGFTEHDMGIPPETKTKSGEE